MVAVFILWICMVVTWSQWQMAPTYDEQNHVARGIAILRTGDFRLVYHHPPLANILEALPVAWRADNGFSTDIPGWRKSEVWPASHAIIWKHPVAGIHLIRLARLPVLLFTIVLAVIVFLWSKSLFGPWGGLFSLAIFALDPNILAHSGLATTDIPVACTIALAIFLLRNYYLHPTPANFLFAGIGTGLALATKFSALILFPIIGLIVLGSALSPQISAITGTARSQHITQVLKQYIVLMVIACITLWGSYGFKIEPFGSKPGQLLPANASLVDHLPVPAMQYFRGLKTVATQAEGHPTYLLGMTAPEGKGWWYYFPVAFAVKTPLPELIAILGMVSILVFPRFRERLKLPRMEIIFLLIPVGLFFMAALGILGISLNLGIRHILPMYPFLLILSGGWALLIHRHRLHWGVLATLLVVQTFSTLKAYPGFLAYFNEPAGGTERGYHLLIDSNCDWGQDLGELAKLQRAQQLYPLTFSYFGTTPPEAYGLRYTPATGYGLMKKAPAPDLAHLHGYFAISVTNLMGSPGYTYGVDYRPLQHLVPYAHAGKSILIYRLPIKQTTPPATHAVFQSILQDCIQMSNGI